MKSKELRTLRKKLGLTQQQLGERLGFGKGGAGMRVSEIERGAAPMSKRVVIICEYLSKEKRRS